MTEADAPALDAPAPEAPAPDAPAPVGSDADRLAHEPPTVCLNCGSVLPGRFCPDCGQRDQPLRQPALVFIAESVSEYFGLDGRLWRSLGLLLVRPGVLTVAYLDGRRTHYLRPLRLYLTATVLFFFFLNLTDPLAESRRTVELRAVPADTSLTPGGLESVLDDRRDVEQAQLDAVRSAVAAIPGLPLADSLRLEAARLETAVEALDAESVRMDALDDDRATEDSLVAVASLPPRVVAALADTGRVEIVEQGQSLIESSFFEDLPEWAQGDLVRRLEGTESPVERRLLAAQYQRSVVRQIPTALILVLPLFALLLKVLYVRGAGRRRRLTRVPAAHENAVWWKRAWAALRRGRWQVGAYRHRRRRRKTARRLRRPVRGAVARARRRVGGLPALRPWRVRRIRLLRRALRGARTRYYAEHLVFALHVHAFTFLMLIVLLYVDSLSSAGEPPLWYRVLATSLMASIPLYFLVAQHRVYGQSWPKTILKSTVLGLAYATLLGGGALLAAGLAIRLG